MMRKLKETSVEWRKKGFQNSKLMLRTEENSRDKIHVIKIPKRCKDESKDLSRRI